MYRAERPKGTKDEVKRPPKGLQLKVGTQRAPTLLIAGPTYRAERPKGVKDEVKRPQEVEPPGLLIFI